MAGNGLVVPGKPIVDTICATDWLSEKILREIAESPSPLRQRWSFGRWTHGVSRGTVSWNGSEPVPLTLHLYAHTVKMGPGVLVIEVTDERRLSLKPAMIRDGAIILTLGDKKLVGNRVRTLACQIVATYVLHGHGWQDRKGREYFEPYGKEPTIGSRSHRQARERRNPRHRRFQSQQTWPQPQTDG